MTPPGDLDTGSDAIPSGPSPAVSVCAPPGIETLRHRPDFLKAASARRHGTPSFLLQARPREDDSPVVRIGFTASKKIGNAVARNRAKRRMRAVARALLPRLAHPGWDYVLVARPGATIDRLYADLLTDMEAALVAVAKGRGP
jgi:ribonuclease P protein component